MDTIIVFDPAPGPDLTAPTLSSTSPADNATDIAIDATIDLVFSETVTLETGNIVLRDNDGGFADLETFNVATGTGSGGGTVALATTSVTNDTVRITPGANMVNSREHAIRVAATCIDDLAGNSYAGITDDTTVSFTTVSGSSAFTDDFSTYSVSDTLDSKAAYNKISPFYNLVVASGSIVQTNGPNDNEETDVEVNQTFSTDHYVEATGRFTTTATGTALRVVVSSDGTDYCWVSFNSDGTVYIEDTTAGFIASLSTFTPNTSADQVFRVEATQSTDTIEAFVDAASLGSDTNVLYDKGGTSGGIGIFMSGGTTAADCHWVDIEVGDQ